MNTIRTGSADTLEVRLLLLDPDFEPLFAEVDEILCEALAPQPRSRCAPIPVPGPEVGRNPALWRYYQRARGRRPGPGRATQRGPPPCWEYPRVVMLPGQKAR